MKTLIIILSVLSFNFSFADSCETVDLREQLGPVLNQDGAGLCYAYTSADILSFKLGKRVSPVDVAMQYIQRRDELLSRGDRSSYIAKASRERKNDIRSGGWVNYALRYSQDAGFCADENINSNDFRGDRDLFKGLVNLNQLSIDGSQSCSEYASIQKVFPTISVAQIHNVATKSDVTNVGSNLANAACAPRFKASEPLKFKNIGNRGTLSTSQFSEVDRILSKKQPISLTVKMDKLYSFGSSDIAKQPIHAITLAGKKFNPATGKCEYILKNSWGPECDRHYKVRCENGYLFVPEEVLKSSILEADYIE